MLFLVVEDFFDEAEGEADVSALELFLVVEAFSVVLAAPVFFAVVDFLVVAAECVVVALVEVAVVSFLLLAQETNNASATTVTKERANLFIGYG